MDFFFNSSTGTSAVRSLKLVFMNFCASNPILITSADQSKDYRLIRHEEAIEQIENAISDFPKLDKYKIKTAMTYVGEYFTSLEMAGFSITLTRLDETLERLVLAKADAPMFKQFDLNG